MTLLDIRQIEKTYPSRSGAKKILKNLSFTVAAGETLALLGRSGCGKSTLMRLLAGLESPEKGRILFEGEALAKMKSKEKKRFYQKTQLVFQDAPSAVNPRFSIEKILSEPLRYLSCLPPTAQKERIKEILKAFHLEEELLSRYPAQLSGGQLQRVCLARGLSVCPKLLLLDEAVSNLDIPLQVQTLGYLKDAQKKQGGSLVFVTHDFRLARKFASRCLVMDQGKIVEEISDWTAQPTHAATILLQSVILPPFPSKAF